MIDPVTGFEYPFGWVKKGKSPELLELVAQGLAILTASGTVLRRGYTTGTTAAAACKAAILSLNDDVNSVSVHIPCGLLIDVQVKAHAGKASCKKYAGDYPDDVTAGLEFVAVAQAKSDGIHLVAGDGIGRFSRDTPRFKKGTSAISNAPLECILASMQEALDATGISGVTVTMSVPKGVLIAKKTLNPQIGVEGGISVLGTTGLVEPWDDHLGESVRARVAAARHPILTTGRIGLRYARLLFPEREAVLVGGKIGEALEAAHGNVILFGLPALILRYINPHILKGTGYATVEELSASSEFDRIVRTALMAFRKKYPEVKVVLVNRDGTIIGESP